MAASPAAGALTLVRTLRVDAGAAVVARIAVALVDVHVTVAAGVAGVAVAGVVGNAVDAVAVHAVVRLAVVDVDVALDAREPGDALAVVADATQIVGRQGTHGVGLVDRAQVVHVQRKM